MGMASRRLPLAGIKVVELAGLAPVPFCGMLLADYGADVVRVDKVGDTSGAHFMGRHKRSICVDLKRPEGVRIVERLCTRSDVLIEPFRPGVMEKLGLGPADVMRSNERLIYARLTGYGQSGPLAPAAGHDINYAAMSGVLSTLGRADERPTPPINLLADFAGGGLMCAVGILAALFERSLSGVGQVVDASMTEGAAYVSTFLFDSQWNKTLWHRGTRGANLLDTGFPIYDTYETADGRHVAVGALEPKFHMQLFQLLGLDGAQSITDAFRKPTQFRAELDALFKTKTRDEWMQLFEGSDACVTPVLSMSEAGEHEHNVARGAFGRCTDDTGRTQYIPQPAPKLSRTPARPVGDRHAVLLPGAHTNEVLAELGYSEETVQRLNDDGTVEQLAAKPKL